MSQNSDHARWIAEEIQPHEQALRGYLRNQFPSIDADDVVQESYLTLLRTRAGLRIASSKAYFFTVARNTARRLFRRRRIYSDTAVNDLHDSLLLDGGADAAEITHARQLEVLVIKAIDQLPARCREIVRLAALEGHANPVIAARLGLSETTIRVQIARGVKKCAAYLSEHGNCR